MDVALIVARILIGLPFLAFGMNHFAMREQMVGYAGMKGAPAPGVTVPLTGLWQIVGALSVILGIYPVVGAWLLLAWLVTVSFIMHPFWKEEGEMKANDMQHFMKHVSWGAALFALIVLNTWGPTIVG